MTSSSQQILQYCKEMKELLLNDKIHFSNNDLTAIESSNQKKISLLTSLNELTAAEKIESSLLEELQSEVLNCYSQLAINSHIVYSNLQHIKETWDQLASFQSDPQYIYDEKGSLSK